MTNEPQTAAEKDAIAKQVLKDQEKAKPKGKGKSKPKPKKKSAGKAKSKKAGPPQVKVRYRYSLARDKEAVKLFEAGLAELGQAAEAGEAVADTWCNEIDQATSLLEVFVRTARARELFDQAIERAVRHKVETMSRAAADRLSRDVKAMADNKMRFPKASVPRF